MAKKFIPKKKKTFHKRKGITRKPLATAKTVKEVTTVVPLTLGCQMFADRYICRGKANHTLAVSQNAGANTNTSYSYQILGNAINSNNVNPNNAGYSITVVPAGIAYLLSNSTSIAGAGKGFNAPYYEYRVTASAIKVQYTQFPDLTNDIVNVAVFPVQGYQNTAWINMPITTINEQPYVKNKLATIYNTTNAMTTVYNSMSTLRLNGDKFKATLESGQFDGNALIPPNSQWQWVIQMQTLNATASNYTMIGQLFVEIWWDIEFFNRNSFNSATAN